MKNDSVLSSLTSTVHFYASLIIGWNIFEQSIYPNFYVSAGHGMSLSAALPFYAVNVLAFGSMVYVGTRPFIVLAEHCVDRLFRNLDRVFENMNHRHL